MKKASLGIKDLSPFLGLVGAIAAWMIAVAAFGLYSNESGTPTPSWQYPVTTVIVLVFGFLVGKGISQLVATLVSFLRAHSPGTAEIGRVVQAVQKAIQKDSSWILPIKSVKLGLQTVQEYKVEGEVGFGVVLKGSYDNATTQEVHLTLTPQSGMLKAKGSEDLITEALHAEIGKVMKQVQPIYTTEGITLKTEEIDVQISFAVTLETSAGVEKLTLKPITLTASGDYSSKTTNTITVTFSKT